MPTTIPTCETYPRTTQCIHLGLYALIPLMAFIVLLAGADVPPPAWAFFAFVWIRSDERIAGEQVFSVNLLLKTAFLHFQNKKKSEDKDADEKNVNIRLAINPHAEEA